MLGVPLYAADVALGSLGSVAQSCTPAPMEYNKMLLPQSGKSTKSGLSTNSGTLSIGLFRHVYYSSIWKLREPTGGTVADRRRD
jgi:hypothetical protein